MEISTQVDCSSWWWEEEVLPIWLYLFSLGGDFVGGDEGDAGDLRYFRQEAEQSIH